MKVIPSFMSKLTLPPGTVGEAIGFQVIDGFVYFRVIWYGRPGIQLVDHRDVEVPN